MHYLLDCTETKCGPATNKASAHLHGCVTNASLRRFMKRPVSRLMANNPVERVGNFLFLDGDEVLCLVKALGNK